MVRFMAEGVDIAAEVPASSNHRGGAGFFHLPIEELTEEGLRFAAIAAADFEMNDKIGHGESLLLGLS